MPGRESIRVMSRSNPTAPRHGGGRAACTCSRLDRQRELWSSPNGDGAAGPVGDQLGDGQVAALTAATGSVFRSARAPAATDGARHLVRLRPRVAPLSRRRAPAKRPDPSPSSHGRLALRTMATTFADHLRSLTDEALGALIQLRPDLVVPVPSDVSALAVRAQSRGSVARCLDGLDEFTLQILDAARLSRGAETALTSVDAIVALAAGRGRPDDVRAAVDRLRARFLLHGPRGRPAGRRRRRRGHLAVPGGSGPPRRLPGPAGGRALRGPARSCAGPCWPRRRAPGPCSTGSPPGRRSARSAGGTIAEPVRWLVEHHILVPVSEAGRAPRPTANWSSCPARSGMLLRRDTGPLGAAAAVPADARRRRPATRSRSTRPAPGRSWRRSGTPRRCSRRWPPSRPRCCAPAASGVRDLQAAGPGRRPGRAGARRCCWRSRTRPACSARRTPPASPGRSRQPGGRRVDEVFLPTGGVRPVAGAEHRPALGDAGPVVAGDDPAARPGRAARRPGPADQRARRRTPNGPAAPQARREVLAALADLPPGTAPPADEVLGLLAWQAPRRGPGPGGRPTATR